jgi:hypothetical protein
MNNTSRRHVAPRYTSRLHIAPRSRSFDPYIICVEGSLKGEAESSEQYRQSSIRQRAARAEQDEIRRRERQEWMAQLPKPTLSERIKDFVVYWAIWAACVLVLYGPWILISRQLYGHH